MSSNTYLPISDYGAIGDLRSVALVGRNGSIDWCCFPHLDRESVFAALLDARRGGRFRVSAGDGRGEQEYVQDTNVLVTRFSTDTGELTVTDFMPISGDINRRGHSQARREIHRLLECTKGNVEVQLEWSPRFDYARNPGRIFSREDGYISNCGGRSLALSGVSGLPVRRTEHGPEVAGSFRLHEGGRRALVCRWESERTESGPEESEALLEETVGVWRDWISHEESIRKKEWAGEWLPLVVRAALAFKLLVHADTGAIAAAPTTSLPETIGGVRNWDYRYTWIRDAAMTAQAMIVIGHETEAMDLLEWMERVSAADEDGLQLQIMYGLHGETELPEKDVSHLEGYKGSRPVRVGNEAAEQFQLETYGELLGMGYELVRRGHHIPEEMQQFLRRVADHVCTVWEEPDYGIWEMRNGPLHFTYSKVMAWVALDRAVRLAEEHELPGESATWKDAMERIRETVLEHGYSEQAGAFVMEFETEDLDAANLRIPLLEFLPATDPKVRSTIDRTLEQLTKNGFVYRYRVDDGLPGEEGAFGLCTFWLIDALTLCGRAREARQLFENVAAHANHLGLFAEQFDPESGAFLGNFPQAFTHIGLINSAYYLACAEGREVGDFPPAGNRILEDGGCGQERRDG